jgi:tripartite motif-containing protein 71
VAATPVPRTVRVLAAFVLTGLAMALISAASASAAYVQQRAWGVHGTAEGQFDSPQGVATVPGSVYVADAYNSRIQAFDPSGNFLFTWGFGVQDGLFKREYCTSACQKGIPGQQYGQIHTPTGIAATKNYVYVADTYNNRVEKFSANGKFLAKWGKTGTGNGQFSHPFGIATDRGGNVYVADTFNDRIQRFSPKGVLLSKWGKPGSGNGQLRAQQDIAVDGQGHVYVADSGNDRIVKYVRTP